MQLSDYRRGLVIGFIVLLKLITTSTVALSLVHTLCNSLQNTLSLPSLLCLHQLSPGNAFQQCRFLGCYVPQLWSSLSHYSSTCCLVTVV
jgi:hypothetical protein